MKDKIKYYERQGYTLVRKNKQSAVMRKPLKWWAILLLLIFFWPLCIWYVFRNREVLIE